MDLDKNSTGNLKKMYANAKPVINPEHRYDRQATFLRIKDLLEERARALSHVPDIRRQAGLPETFEDRYIYPYSDNITPQYPMNSGSNYAANIGYSHSQPFRQKSSPATKYENKFVMPGKKYTPPAGPDRKVFRGQKSIPYSAYSSSYGTYPNHAILSLGNADHGVPRWEIRAVPRDGPIHDPLLKRKVTIDDNAQMRYGFGRPNPKPMTLETQRALKSILKKGTTSPSVLSPDIFDRKGSADPDLLVHRQTSSEEILMLAKETALKRHAINKLNSAREKIPTVDKKSLKNKDAGVVTWLKPAFLDYATSETVAMPDAMMEKLKRTFISSNASDATDSKYSSTFVAD